MPAELAVTGLDLFATIGFVDGVGFDPFFRGLLSVLVGVVVLCGGTYLLVATNVGTRGGFLISAAALFGWMMLYGIIWTIYGIGWVGEAASWDLKEVVVADADDPDEGLIFAETESAQKLDGVDLESELGDIPEDPDAAQLEATDFVSANPDFGNGWRYLPTSDPFRGEAQASADAFFVEEGIFDTTEEYVPLNFGGFTTGGKPVLVDSPNLFERVWHTFDEAILNPVHTEQLMAIQVVETKTEPELPGQPPPVAEPDEGSPLYTMIMERDRGGPFPWLISGLRFTPFLFTLFNAILFGVLCWSLHTRDKRLEKITAAGAV